MSVVSRKGIREAIATLISSNLTGAGQPFAAVYDYLPPSFGDNAPSPICVVQSDGAMPFTDAFGGSAWANEHYFLIINYILYDDKQSAYDREDAEDILDDCQYAIANLFQANQGNGSTWDDFEFYQRSRMLPVVEIGGDSYLPEAMPVKVIKT